MKIRVTFDVSDKARAGINLVKSDSFAPATREQIDAYIQDLVTADLDKIVGMFDQVTAEIKARIKANLDA